MTTFEKARAFIYRNARPLDLARFQYHFENGGKEAVLTALSYYQNEDGGFGHALEADAWNPNTSPIQTWCATELLREIDFVEADHPMMHGMLRYLESGKAFDGDLWDCTVKSNNDFPHAPWWHTQSDSTCHHDDNPTACLAGFIVRFAHKDSELYALGCRIVKNVFHRLLSGERQRDMHTIACYIRMMEYCKQSGETFKDDIISLESKLREMVSTSITTDVTQWEQGYVCKPSQFVSSKDSVFYKDNQDMIHFECDYIVKSQCEDGSWNIPWSWSAYPDAWAISKNWWKSNGAIANLLFLKNIR